MALRSSIFAVKKTIHFRSIFECLAPVGGRALYVGVQKKNATPRQIQHFYSPNRTLTTPDFKNKIEKLLYCTILLSDTILFSFLIEEEFLTVAGAK